MVHDHRIRPRPARRCLLYKPNLKMRTQDVTSWVDRLELPTKSTLHCFYDEWGCRCSTGQLCAAITTDIAAYGTLVNSALFTVLLRHKMWLFGQKQVTSWRRQVVFSSSKRTWHAWYAKPTKWLYVVYNFEATRICHAHKLA